MTFDVSQLGLIGALLTVVLGGIALLVIEAFASEGNRSRAFMMPLTLVILAVAFGIELLAWQNAGETGAVRTLFDGMLSADRFSIFCGQIFLLGAALSVLLAPGFMREHRFEFGEYYSLVCFGTAGMMVLAMATDLLAVFIGLETMSLAIYVLTGSWRRSPRSSEGAMKYFLVGAFATAVFLYGVALVYGATGSVTFKGIAAATASAKLTPILVIGMLLILSAFAFKIGAVPFHMWTPDAYEGAPSPVTAFMAAGVKAAGFATLLRIVGVAFVRPELTYGASGWASILAVLAALTMTLGNLAALRQHNIKRLLAYSSISHAGYLLVGVVATSLVGAEARGPILFYLLAYTFTTVGSFGVVAWIGSRGDERLDLDDWAGLGRRHPAAALAMTVFLLSLGGFPPTAGFFAKFYVFRAALAKPGMLPLIIVAVLNSAVSVYYYLRVVTQMYFREPGARELSPNRAPGIIAALILATLGTFALGLFPGWVIDLASAALF